MPGTHQLLRLIDNSEELIICGVVQLPAAPIEAHLGRFARLVGVSYPRSCATWVREVAPLTQNHVGGEVPDLSF
jgi:hypothetical protein